MKPAAPADANIRPPGVETGEALVERDLHAQAQGERAQQLSVYSCPECRGVLWQINHDKLVQFRCHVGHTYSPELLLVEKSEDLEAALWSAVRALVEKATLTRQLADSIRRTGDAERASAIEEQAQQTEEQLHLIRTRVLGQVSNPASTTYEIDRILDAADADTQHRDEK